MEIIYIILLVIIIYLLITNKTDYNRKIDRIDFQLQELHKLFRQNAAKQAGAVEEKTVNIPRPELKPPPEETPPAIAPPTIIPEKKWHKEVINDVYSPINRPPKTFKSAYQPEPEEENELSFFERYPDLEKFIGENLVNKIGIAILVLAIGFFVKYAIDNNWIGPVGRVGIGVLCGGILIGIAHRLRNSYKAFSSVLVGGGLAILYFTITLAYHQFHLFNQTTSFIIMIAITGFAVLLSLLYDKQELAVIALIGGLSSPFLVSSGHANYQALFAYLVILNIGLLIIAYYKLWRILNTSAFALTVIIFGGTLLTLEKNTYLTGFIYATTLYLLFFVINIANNVRENKVFIALDFSVLLTNTALYFAAGLYLLTAMDAEHFRGLFTATLGAINLILSFFLFRFKKVDNNILYLLIGVTLSFISLTAPIQLHGHNITLFWATETVLLFWLYQKSGIQLMKLASLLIWGAMLISLCWDWLNIYGGSGVTLTIIANKGFITTVVAAISSYLLSVLIDKSETEQVYGISINADFYRYAGFIFLFLSGVLEINHQFLSRYPDTSLNSIYLMLYAPVFIFTGFMALNKLAHETFLPVIYIAIISLTILTYFAFIQNIFDAQYIMLVAHKSSTWHFMAHWVGAIFVGLLFYQLIKLVKDDFEDGLLNTATWILTGAIVLFLSLEICLACNLLCYSTTTDLERIQTVYIKVGLPILWGLSSFALMWLGMRYKTRSLRIVSLTLFLITLLKLFIFDIQNIPPAGKIAAFFCLGVLLLIISFMYQKVKKIIVDDVEHKKD